MSPGSARVASRIRRAVDSFQSAAHAIGTISPGFHVFALTRGQWSMLDAVLAVLDQTGPAHVSVWTWRVAEYEVEVLGNMRDDARILSGRLIVDGGAARTIGGSSARSNVDASVDEWRRRHGPDSVRYLRNHAKIARVWNDSYRLLLRGSMNLNFNPRFEQFDISEGGEAFDLVTAVEDALPVLQSRDWAGMNAASGVTEAFTPGQLRIFEPEGMRVWGK